ncbi:MAG: glycosyltransferase family 2 protein, partial [Pseudolabrys sp.]
MQKPAVWVICPAFNEAATIVSVVADLRRCRYNVVVVDDGSTDATRHVAATVATTVVAHPVNLGQGAALKTGIDYALSQGAEILVTFDADGQHRAENIAGLVRALKQEPADFALGSRRLGQSRNMPFARRVFLFAATLFTVATTGLCLTDTHNGLRAFTRRGASALSFRQNRMAHASEILTDIANSGL